MKSLTGKSESLPHFTNQLAKVNMTTKDLLDDYAGCYVAINNCLQCIDIGDECKMCTEDTERMQEIEKELEVSIRREVVSEILEKLNGRYYGWNEEDTKYRESVVSDVNNGKPLQENQVWNICQARMKDSVKEYALSKGIILQ